IGVSHQGVFFPGSATTNLVFTVVNSAQAGPTTGQVTISDTLPSGLTVTSFAGQVRGWDCQGSTQVTCTNNGPLQPGDNSAFPIPVTIAGGTRAGDVTNTATVTTAGDSNPANNVATDVITIASGPPPPDLSIDV